MQQISDFPDLCPQDKRKAYLLEAAFRKEQKECALLFVEELKALTRLANGVQDARAFIIDTGNPCRLVMAVSFNDFLALETWYRLLRKNSSLRTAKKHFLQVRESILSNEEIVEVFDIKTRHSSHRHKLAFLTWLCLYPFVNLILLTLNNWSKDVHQTVITLLATVFAVIIMNYIISPLMERLPE